jgi:hypothetical protein
LLILIDKGKKKAVKKAPYRWLFCSVMVFFNNDVI